ncbi:hypothetical protein RER_46480 [Rhodococcus erythropolis PR4]|uniref:Amidohydrolase family protein n=1 Tax=Rhodococcus erythropolis (strain PR4 / NBRC 100887) TaxID=234621 RepID=C0ZMU8_RHOE4|nr:hypothetical protein RER_46480 [Rhodococcus erythropolis PR4]
MRSVPRLRGRLAGTISLLTAAVVVATAGVSAAAPSPAPTAQNSVYALANGCFALRTESGDFVRRDGSAYLTDVTKAADAEPFRLHAAQLGRFMLYGPDGSMLSHDGADSVLATSEATPSTDWTVMSTGESFVLTATSNGRQLISRDLMLTMSDPGDVPESAFTLIPRDGCADFPEAKVGANGVPGEIGPNGEVTGFIDTHVHMNASEFMGGNLHCGRPFDPQGVTAALVDCPDHQPDGIPALLENVLSYGNPFETHDTTGWPSFADWPAHDSLTHEQTYYKWVERAWRGGLRIFTNLFVANRVLCELYPSKRNPCDEMETVRIQAQQTRELQDYIDAQYGGPGRGWFRIVSSPEQARQVAADGKLAVTLGVEVSEPFGCSVRNGIPQCTEDDIDRGLDELYDLGVRQMIVTHKFDNALGGARFDGGVTGVAVNIGNYLGTGEFWQSEPCTGECAAHQGRRRTESSRGTPTRSDASGVPLWSAMQFARPDRPRRIHDPRFDGPRDDRGHRSHERQDRRRSPRHSRSSELFRCCFQSQLERPEPLQADLRARRICRPVRRATGRIGRQARGAWVHRPVARRTDNAKRELLLRLRLRRRHQRLRAAGRTAR